MSDQGPQSRSGTVTCWRPEWFNEDKNQWLPIPATDSAIGVPYPRLWRGLLLEMNACGESQALALAHWFAATAEAESYKSPQVRIVPYVLTYALKLEPKL